ncbi:hypothetical protein [Clostridium sardiniense]|nr:hypothetical protein [Clostridium sardiniense]MDQ0460363.1 hypothetical protein [Clostridium sardiniense]
MQEEIKVMVDKLDCMEDRKKLRTIYAFLKGILSEKKGLNYE